MDLELGVDLDKNWFRLNTIIQFPSRNSNWGRRTIDSAHYIKKIVITQPALKAKNHSARPKRTGAGGK